MIFFISNAVFYFNNACAIVEDDNEECYTLSTRMNMSQLAFIKQLCYVERVKTDESTYDFLMSLDDRLLTIAHYQ